MKNCIYVLPKKKEKNPDFHKLWVFVSKDELLDGFTPLR